MRRLKVSTSTWPREELKALGEPLPPQTPCEYVEESLCWWAFGKYQRAEAAQRLFWVMLGSGVAGPWLLLAPSASRSA